MLLVQAWRTTLGKAHTCFCAFRRARLSVLPAHTGHHSLDLQPFCWLWSLGHWTSWEAGLCHTLIFILFYSSSFFSSPFFLVKYPVYKVHFFPWALNWTLQEQYFIWSPQACREGAVFTVLETLEFRATQLGEWMDSWGRVTTGLCAFIFYPRVILTHLRPSCSLAPPSFLFTSVPLIFTLWVFRF
jgi:hypothetical protein